MCTLFAFCADKILYLQRKKRSYMKAVIHIVFLFTFCLSCAAQENSAFKRTFSYTRQDGRKTTVKLKTISDSLSVIQYFIGRKKSDEWQLKYPVYQFDCGDINGDSIPEIAVGVIKKTRYSHFVGKRLFIFKLFDEEVIRPFWLSSRLSHELLDFRIEQLEKGSFIRTVEKNTNGEILELRYKTSGFGLKFEEYVTNN